MNGTLYFTADDGVNGRQLWKTDGTDVGTVIVKNINAAGASESNFFALNGLLYFDANDGAHGTELWKTDGTLAGTLMVSDINSGPADSSPAPLNAIGSELYYTADDGIHGRELWQTDGTTAGTTLVNDINPGAASADVSLTAVIGNTLFFRATDAQGGAELWKTVGTSGGTVLVDDINPGPSSSSPASFTVIGSELFFTADDGTHGQEVWQSDGTSAGTHLLADAYVGTVGSTPANLTVVDGKLLFSANDGIHGNEPWTSDGTPAGTTLLADINAAAPHGFQPSAIIAQGNHVIFSGGQGPLFGLWASDGTPTGTIQLMAGPNIVQDGGNPAVDGPTEVNVGGIVYFAGYTGLWRTDGTPAGTYLVKSFSSAGQPYPLLTDLTEVNGALYFSATSPTYGEELWSSDGTDVGTHLLTDLAPGAASSHPRHITDVNGTVFFTALGQLYRTDGTAAGTVQVNPSVVYNDTPETLGGFVNLKGTLFFRAAVGISNYSPTLWKSDGTAAGTVPVMGVAAPVVSYSEIGFNGSLYFMGANAAGSDSLWKTNGTPAGTTLVASLDTGSTANLTGGQFCIVNNSLFFSGPNEGELWRSDGTTAGTVLVTTLPDNPQYSISEMTNAGGHLYFTDNDRLWTTDGTAVGTVTVDNPPDGSQFAGPSWLAVAESNLFFAEASLPEGQGVQLWELAPAPPSTISGLVFNDSNSDLIRQPEELSLPGWTVYLDMNNNGVLDADEPQSITNTAGGFQFNGLLAGTYTVRPAPTAGWHVTTVGSVTVHPAAGQTALVSFGVVQNPVAVSSISGTVFNDIDANASRAASEAGLAGWKVYLDSNNNGRLDAAEMTTTTSSQGVYHFTNLAVRTYVVREVVPAGWRLDSQSVVYSPAHSSVKSATINFADTAKSVISGTVFRDLNGNNKQDAGDTPLAGWRIFLDTNNDGKRESNEASVLTDSKGNYSFVVPAGHYRVVEIIAAGFHATLPSTGTYTLTTVAGQVISGRNFANR